MYTPLNQYHVVMEVDPQFWQNPEGLKHIYIPTPTGARAARRLHPLRAQDRAARRSTTRASSRRSRSPSTSRRAWPSGRPSTRSSSAEAEIGLPAGIHGSFQGTAQAFQASLANEPILILAAVLAVYIVLGMLYESLIHP